MGKVRTTRPTGRYVKRTPEMEEEILDRVGAGESLRQVCSGPKMPTEAAVRKWAVTDPEFGRKFVIARMIQAHGYAEAIQEELMRPLEAETVTVTYKSGDTEEVVDKAALNAHVQLRRLRVDTWKWALSKMLPKLYGDRLTLAGDADAPLRMGDDEVMREILSLLATAKTRQLRDPNNRVGQN